MWVLLVGYGGSGKDTAADHICEKYADYEKLAFADSVREFAVKLNVFLPELGMRYNEAVATFGYEEAKKHFCVRDHLVKIGHGGRETLGGMVWMNNLYRKAENRPNGGINLPLVISDGRYANEAAFVRDRGNAIVIRLKRKGCKWKHQTEKDSIREIVPDRVVRNDGTIEDLRFSIDEILQIHRRFREISAKEGRGLKAYVAGAYTDQDTVQAVQAALSSNGFHITKDWTTKGGNLNHKQIMFEDQSQTVLANDAAEDVKGVENAEFVVFVFNNPHYPYRGTCTELGMALAYKKRIFVLHMSPPEEKSYLQNPFLWLPQIAHVHSLDELLLKLTPALLNVQ